jgi:hypothetical protein
MAIIHSFPSVVHLQVRNWAEKDYRPVHYYVAGNVDSLDRNV